MWPERKILLLVPHGLEGWQGIFSLLNALHKNVVVKITSPESQMDSAGIIPLGTDAEIYDLSDVGPTEILYWPGIQEEDTYRQWGQSRGLIQIEISEFLQRYWEEEILLPVAQIESEDEPLLWKILNQAGFEPSLLWQNDRGKWEVRIGNGLHWIIPETWFKGCWGTEVFGRQPERVFTESCWVDRGDRVEFYSDEKNYEYLGFIMPYKDKSQEGLIYSTVLLALQLGVPWRSIQRTYDGLAINSGCTNTGENIRWYGNDMARDEWTGGTPIPTKESEYMANRGVG